MRTNELHRTDAYLRTFDATVVAVEHDLVELSATAFYARSGGQLGDQGSLRGHRVLDTFYSSTKSAVLHRVVWSADPLRVGEEVIGQIDWDRRYAAMRLHTAQHLLWLSLVAEYGPDQNECGGDIGVEKARLDVDWVHDQRPSAELISKRLAMLVAMDSPIQRYLSDVDENRWEWKVDGFPPIPCGGTHVRRTGEVGRVNVGVKGKGKNVARLTVTLA